MFPSFLPSDEQLAAKLGISDTWVTVAPMIGSVGYLLWYMIGALFLLLELIIPGFALSWIGFAAIAAGVFFKLGLVYEWGHFTFAEQTCFFLLFSVVAVALWTRFGRIRVRNAVTDLDRRA